MKSPSVKKVHPSHRDAARCVFKEVGGPGVFILFSKQFG